MAIQLATTDSVSRAPSVAAAHAAPLASDGAASSPFDLLLHGPAVTGSSEQADPAAEIPEGPAEDIDLDGNDPQAQAIVAPVVVLPMLPPEAATLDAPTLDAHEELPQEFVPSTAAEPAAELLAFTADGNLAVEPATTSVATLFPSQEPGADDSIHGLADALPKTNVPAVAIAADASAAAEPDTQPAESHPTAEFDTGESSGWEQAKDGDRLSELLPVPAADTPPAGLPAATTTPLEPPASSLTLQPPVVAQAPRSESQPVANSQPAASDSRPIDTARLLHRVARAFAAAKDGGEVRLRLSPPELGSLTLDVRVQEGALVARLEAETTSVRTVLVENLSALRDRLAEQGIRLERFDVDLRQPGGGSPDWSAHQPFQESGSREQPARERRPPQVAEGVVARTTRVPSQDALSHDLKRLNVIV
jgi:hypothetical protein